MISRSASGEGESLKAAMIHCSFGMTTSRARITAPISQFTTMRIRSTTYAIGSAADDEAGVDMIHRLLISTINNIFIDCRQVGYWKTIRMPRALTGALVEDIAANPQAVTTDVESEAMTSCSCFL